MRILVTGAGRAIGRATVIECTRRGHEVVATARDGQLIADLDVAQRLVLDVTDPDSVRAALDAAGELDGVVNNATLQGRGPLEDFPLDRLHSVIDTNTYGPVTRRAGADSSLARSRIGDLRQRELGAGPGVDAARGCVCPRRSMRSKHSPRRCTTSSLISGSAW